MGKNHLLFLFTLGLLISTISSESFAGLKAAECQIRPDFLNNPKSTLVKNIDALPHLVFVARKADYYVENKEQSFKLWGQQSFTRVDSKVLCATIPAFHEGLQDLRFSIYAPTLMDLTGDQKVGDSFWQFHLMADGTQVGIWNQKSRMYSKAKDFESRLAKMGVQVQVFQISHDEFEVILTRESKQFTETLSVRFDSVSEVR